MDIESGSLAGQNFGPYEVKALLGAGGMGEVYRARDTQLKRDVAIKVLPDAFSREPDRRIVFSDVDPATGYDIWSLSLDTDRKLQPVLKTSFSELNLHLSANGKWLAFTSEESGRSEVYVRPFPKLDGKWKVSTDGGTEPVWSRDGRELFYRNGDKMMQVGIESGPVFVASPPRVLFEGRFHFSGTSISAYDISPDGRRFLMIQPAEDVQPETQIHIVLNWSEGWKTR